MMCRHISLFCAQSYCMTILIRNNVNIKGIKIENKRFLITQYADNTSLHFDGSEKSLVRSLRVSKLYASISSLRMNVDKTSSLVWIKKRK